ncbi:glycoside hydrolase family 2 TIM barrel-domain containing protein [Planctomycetota bacterium]
MRIFPSLSFFIIVCIAAFFVSGVCRGGTSVRLPEGVRAVWDAEKAYRQSTSTRERICINGLWRWQPADEDTNVVPTEGWGYFKVPGCWPGITNYMQKDSQTFYAHPDWKDRNLRNITATWYQRQVTIPSEWTGRRITIQAKYLNSHATVYLDGQNAGTIVFPGGELDLTDFCHPGKTHVLSLFVTAMPLKGVMLSYSDTASAKKVKGSVARRGLCGDVYLESAPARACILDMKVNTSVRKWEIVFDTALDGLAAEVQYTLRVRITEDNRNIAEFTSETFEKNDLRKGRISFTKAWKPEKLWDIHTPQDMYTLSLSLLETNGKVVDVSHPERFGFREFWIDGRDFFLNGTRIFLSSVPLDNAQVGAALANYKAAKESMERLQSFGINFVYTHNYGCEPGSHLSFEEVLNAADDVGMLVSFSQPHFSHYDWEMPDADEKNGYARHAEFYVRVARNHPSVVFYSMSHNATGYSEDMNPDMIDGIRDARDTWSLRNAKRALRAEGIVKDLDSSRIVYHHASGNLGPMHTSNFYANFAPIQEMSDWFEHWATEGVKPLFTCEYSVPFPWDWTMYRGWYQGNREFGSAVVPWEFCLAEWNSQFFGDRAFRISEMEKANLRWEARQFRSGKLWHRWDYPHAVSSDIFTERQGVYAMYFNDNWRAFRTWGVSAISPWSHGHYWILRDGVDKSRKEFQVDWDNLQRPGFSPDYIERRYERVDLAFNRSDWVATVAAQALIRNNRPLLAYIGGKPGAFTSKDHNFLPGETVEKQLIVINNSRETVTCNCEWVFDLPKTIADTKQVTILTGQQQRVPLRFDLPTTLAPGKYELRANFHFDGVETQTDCFSIDIMPPQHADRTDDKIALFDPNGQTQKLLDDMGIQYQLVDTNTDLLEYDTLIVGKSALTVESPAPDIARVRDGLKVLLFEQTADVLEKRFGFRVAEYGLRQVFKRVPDHPLMNGIKAENLCNWRGEATILPSRLKYEMRPRYGPTVKWCGIPVTRLWRCGNRGNVASVLIEKPARGDFLPILDGGYSLQYSPLMEYREGLGMVLFCQMDITGRTEDDPAARTLARNILRYVSAWKPAPRRQVIYVGDPAGRRHLESTGISLTSYDAGNLSANHVLVVGPGGERKLAGDAPVISNWLKTGGNLLAVGLDEQQANAFLPLKVRMKEAEHISAYFEPFGFNSLFTGIGPADVLSREPRVLPLVSAGVAIIGDGILASSKDLNIVFCQLAPWQFSSKEPQNVKRTFRRISYHLARLLANMGVAGSTPVLERFGTPINISKEEKRWLKGLYLDVPEEWDDPYRFFRW